MGTTQTYVSNYSVHIIKPSKITEYHFMRTYNPECFHRLFSAKVLCELKLYSWTQAFDVCEQIGGKLPQIISRKEQEELLHMLKSSTDIFAVEALFIGLYSHSQLR